MPDIWGHRGASGSAPENTLAAFELAARMGAAGVELDAQLSADGDVVVIHDDTVDRTTPGTGSVQDHDAATLARWGVPRLADVLALLESTGLVVNVELKYGARPQQALVAAALTVVGESRWPSERIWWSSFRRGVLPQVRRLDPTAQIGLLFDEGELDASGVRDVALKAMRSGAGSLAEWAVHPHWRDVAALANGTELAETFRAAARPRIHTWTVNDPAAAAQATAADVVITNHPDRARSWFN